MEFFNKKIGFYIICGILLSISVYFYTNPYAIDLNLAEISYKNDDIQNSLRHYEKAFSKGLEDPKIRENYVNILINSPLKTESQKKLFEFIKTPVDDIARLKAELFLTDLKREIHRKYIQNYISQAVYNQKIVRWADLPITYGFKNIESSPIYFSREIENAFWEWEKLTDRQITFNRDDQNPNIIIDFKQTNPATVENKKYVVAYTYPQITLGKLEKMNIDFYLKDVEGNFFSENQVYNTALHEIVHALGVLGHSTNKEDIMYLTKDSVSVTEDLRDEPTVSDINTLKLLYKIEPEISNSKDYDAEYIVPLVLGGEQEINNAKIKEAKIYIKNAPELPAGYIDLADGYVSVKNYAKAIKTLEKALELTETKLIRSMIYYNLAVSYFHIDNLEMSYDYLTKSIKLNDSEEKHYLLGDIFVREGNFTKAIEEYKYLIQKNPKNIDYTIALTNIYILKHDYLNARKVLKSFAKNNPNEKNNSRLNSYGILKIFL